LEDSGERLAVWEVSVRGGRPSGRLSFTQTLSETYSGSFFRHRLFSTTSAGLFLALFFPQLRIFKNLPALFSGLFRFVFGGQTFVINNYSGLFF